MSTSLYIGFSRFYIYNHNLKRGQSGSKLVAESSMEKSLQVALFLLNNFSSKSRVVSHQINKYWPTLKYVPSLSRNR